MLRKIYDWVMSLAASRHAPVSLAAVSFAESSFFPIPPDVMLAPMVLARPDRAFVYAGICTAASVVGGLFGYLIGYWLEPLAHQFLAFMGHTEGQDAYRQWFADYGLWVILGKGVTPIPYKLVTIAAGLAQYSLVTFIWASVLTRGARFFLAAALIKYFGPAVREEVEKRLMFYTILAVVLIVGGLVAAKLFL